VIELDLAPNSSGASFSPDRRHRYLLWRDTGSGHGTALFIGLNPSTAAESVNDPTIRRCITFSRNWGFSRLIVANLFAYRATKPADLRSSNEPIGPLNDQWIEFASRTADLTIAAWGNDGLWLGRHRSVLPLLVRPMCLGMTKQLAPRHPLYVHGGQQPMLYAYSSNGDALPPTGTSH
jgi:hypothetical protein